jgi:flagellar biosynthesis protein FlhF
MNVRRFSARTSREAFALVRQSFGEDAVVLSTRPSADGVEVLAMPGDSVPRDAPVAAEAVPAPLLPALRHPVLPSARGQEPMHEPAAMSSVEQDVAQLSMSTLSFQDYVRERMLRRRQAEKQAIDQGQAEVAAEAARAVELAARPSAPASAALRERADSGRTDNIRTAPAVAAIPVPPVLHESMVSAPAARGADSSAGLRATNGEMLDELRAMRGLIEDRFGALAFMEKLQRQPRQAQLTQRLLEQGFSPALIRKLSDSLPDDVDPSSWAAGVLERNLLGPTGEAALEDSGGVFALIGATGVGKTTSTAKLAAAFATRHGAGNLGLITLDAYRVAAHEQLRAYGRILGVPVHTAHDRASLEDLLELLVGKKMVLIDTAGMAQRDTRTRELLDMLSHASVNRLLVVNAAAQGETIEDVLQAYSAASCRGVILSKLDEAVKLGPALDAVIRHKLKVLAVANGQRVPEDWHRLSANALVQQALRCTGQNAWRMDVSEMNLVFAGMRSATQRQPAAAHA